MAHRDVSQRCKVTSDLGATADIGRPYGLDGSVDFEPRRHGTVREPKGWCWPGWMDAASSGRLRWSETALVRRLQPQIPIRLLLKG
jgi:hypothetical protein